MKKLYVKVTQDAYELPVAVADSMAELARMVGVHQSAISQAYKKIRNGEYRGSIYKIVEVDDE